MKRSDGTIVPGAPMPSIAPIAQPSRQPPPRAPIRPAGRTPLRITDDLLQLTLSAAG
jgi:hypothetical protein